MSRCAPRKSDRRATDTKAFKMILLFVVFLMIPVSSDAWTWTGQTGVVNDIILGPLVDSSVIQEKESRYVDYTIDLGVETYDIYIPANYDGTQPFGLMSFISAGDNAVVPQAYKRGLDARNIIWVGGNNIGNTQYSRRRRGLAIAAIYRAMEVFNIDPDRVYVSGSSGGGRVVSGLYWVHPELVKGIVANIGSAFPKDLPEMYIDRSAKRPLWPEYEYDSFTIKSNAYINNVQSYQRPFAITTGYDDFREEYLLLIHHQGLKPYGFDSKVFSYDKGHSYAVEQQFYDALSFIEHPRFLRVEDSFDNTDVASNGGAGDGFYSFSQAGATVSESSGGLALTPTGTAVASVASKTPLQWYDEYGAMMDFSFKTVPVAGVYNQRTSFGVWLEQGETFSSYRQPNHLQTGSLTAPQNTASLLFSIEQTSGSSKLIFEVNNAVNTTNEHNYQKVFEVEFSSAGDAELYPGWVENAAQLDVRLHLMDTELIMEFSRHFDATTFQSITGVVLLDDYLTIRVPWDKLAAGKKWRRGVDLADVATNSWPTSKRCLFTIATEALDLGGATPGTVEVSKVKIRDAGASLSSFDFTSYVAPDLNSSIEYSGLSFSESLADDGSVGNEIKLILIDDIFTGANGSSLLASGKATVLGVPSGLTATLVKDHDTQVTLRLLGNATAHEVTDSVRNMSISFADSAFSGGNASGIAQSTRNDLGVQFLGGFLIVTNGLDAGSGSLREAIAQASDNTPIQFDPVVSFIHLTGGEILIDKSLVLDGGGSITIDGGGNSRIFQVYHAVNTLNVSLLGFTLENAKNTGSGTGGAIHNNEETLLVDHCHFNSNIVEYDGGSSLGGAIWSKGDLTLRNSTFVGNQAKHVAGVNVSSGGAIYKDGGALTVEDCLFENNLAEALSSDTVNKNAEGGAIAMLNNCTGVMTRVEIRGNQVSSPGSGGSLKGTANGGGVFVSKSVLNLIDSTLDSNSAGTVSGSGGGIYCWSTNQTTSLTLERCTVSNNSVVSTNTSRGGAIAVNTGADDLLALTLKNCTVSGNSVQSTAGLFAQGGAIYQYRGTAGSGNGMTTLLIYNTTFSENDATSSNLLRGRGGAFFLGRGEMTLESVIVANNTATDIGKDIFMDASNFGALTVHYSLIESEGGNHGLVNGVDHNIVGIDPALGALTDNGGLTLTHALLIGSPAYNAGSNVLSLINDQRGSGYARVLNGQADMGAHEGVAQSLDAWAAGYGLTSGNESGNADPDRDGMANVMEYLIGADPLTVGAIKMRPVLNGNNQFGLSYQSSRAVEPSDVLVVIERSFDLGVTDPWVAVPATYSVSGNGSGNTIYTHTWMPDQPSVGAAREFIRMRVSSQ